MKLLRFAILAAAVVVPADAAQQRSKPAATGPQAITVYRTASCGCCGKWVEHLQAAGFEPTVHMVDSIEQAPPRKDVPAALQSCHTATLEGYVVEGHVPAEVIRQLLKERPRVQGIAVPGMPPGSPGMESSNPQPYDVLTFDANGRTTVFASR
ncbi:MAG TPA: DUF411 domain-containing protein [Longimicrobiales bacterium]|nr:DUF411 domain-containing protein [Longimicrobiales bacterium]